MATDGWDGRSVRDHVGHVLAVASQAGADVLELREALEDELDRMKDRLAEAERAASEALARAQRACDELAELRRCGGAAAAAAVPAREGSRCTIPPLTEGLAGPAVPSMTEAERRCCGVILTDVEDVAGSAAIAAEETGKLHGELGALRRRWRLLGLPGASLAAGDVTRRLDAAETAALIGLEAANRASDELEALGVFLAAMEPLPEGKRHE